jgi:hypothetical protein
MAVIKVVRTVSPIVVCVQPVAGGVNKLGWLVFTVSDMPVQPVTASTSLYAKYLSVAIGTFVDHVY